MSCANATFAVDKSAAWTPVTSSPDLVLEREGHCCLTASLKTHLASDDAGLTLDEFVVVIGGFVDGGFEPTAIAARIPHHTSSPTAVVSLEWFVCATSSSVCEVDGMSAVADDDQQSFWLFGGMDGETYTPRNKLYRAQWKLESNPGVEALKECASVTPNSGNKRLQLDFGIRDGSDGAVVTTGDCPAPRYRHSAAYSSTASEMYIFGGVTESSNQTNDFFALNTITLVWRKIEVGAIVPRPRFLAVLLLAVEPTAPDDNDNLTTSSLTGEVVLVMCCGAHFQREGEQQSLSDAWAIRLPSPLASVTTTTPNNTPPAVWEPLVSESRDGIDMAHPAVLPCVNGHCGLVLPPRDDHLVQHVDCLIFGGKDFTRGTNNIAKLSFDVNGGQAIDCSTVRVTEFLISGHTDDDIAAAGGEDVYVSDGAAPHWRYTGATSRTKINGSIGAEGNDCFLVAGQCRHNDPSAVYALNWSAFV